MKTKKTIRGCYELKPVIFLIGIMSIGYPFHATSFFITYED